MPTELYGGVARTTINPLLGTRKIGMRLFGDPVQAIESDLTATILVVDDTTARVALVACDHPASGYFRVAATHQRGHRYTDFPCNDQRKSHPQQSSFPRLQPRYSRTARIEKKLPG